MKQASCLKTMLRVMKALLSARNLITFEKMRSRILHVVQLIEVVVVFYTLVVAWFMDGDDHRDLCMTEHSSVHDHEIWHGRHYFSHLHSGCEDAFLAF